MTRLFVLAGLLLASPALAQAQAAPPVQVEDAWARATPPGATTAGIYMTVTSPAADTLTGASTPDATTASVHRTEMTGDVMRMRPVTGGLALPAGTPVKLAPGGYHLMLEGLKGPLKAGATVPLHLTFANAAPLDVVATVRPLGAAAHVTMPGM